jgi:hypothetical protein
MKLKVGHVLGGLDSIKEHSMWDLGRTVSVGKDFLGMPQFPPANRSTFTHTRLSLPVTCVITHVSDHSVHRHHLGHKLEFRF